MGIDSVARQMHQKTVQHYWVNIVKQQVTGGGCPTLEDTLIQPIEAALKSKHVSDRGIGTVRRSD